MKYIGFVLTVCISLFYGCHENDPWQNEDLSNSAEGILSINPDQQIYVDENRNEYLSVSFDIDKTSSVYGVFMEKGKKYYISAAGNSSENLELLLLKSNYDTLFTGEFVMTYHPRKYIAWTSKVTDTFYIKINYIGDINFHSIDYQITFEDLTNKYLDLNELKLKCSGDWFTAENGSLGLVCHQTSTTKWAKIENDSLYNFSFSYGVTSKSGKPDNYIGIACYASTEIYDKENVPANSYKFDFQGPASWRLSNWMMESGAGVGFNYGNTAENINIGTGNLNYLELLTYGDSISCSINQECVTKFRNLHFINNGLYITVEDTKKDTIYFDDIVLDW